MKTRLLMHFWQGQLTNTLSDKIGVELFLPDGALSPKAGIKLPPGVRLVMGIYRDAWLHVKTKDGEDAVQMASLSPAREIALVYADRGKPESPPEGPTVATVHRKRFGAPTKRGRRKSHPRGATVVLPRT